MANINKTCERIIENPFFLALSTFALAASINYLLETEFTKNLFNWIGYYFNYTLYSLNSILQPGFKDHPYIHMAVLTNPITPEVMAALNPWMWLRGFIISSYLISQFVTLLLIKKIKAENVILSVISISILQMISYLSPYSSMISYNLFTEILQKSYINLLVLMFFCYLFFSSGIEYAAYLIRNGKFKVTFVEGIRKIMDFD